MTRIPDGVGWTALLTAYGRAQESREATKLFHDPLASTFIAAVTDARVSGGGDLPRLGPAVDDGSSALWNVFQFYFCERTPFYDQHVLRAMKDGCRQVVLVAAGLDSRAFRLGLPADVTVFELDQAAVLDFKQSVLDQHEVVPTCSRVPVPVHLLDSWSPSLLAAGFDGSRPTIWIAEGFLMYLSSSDAEQLLATVTALSAPGSHFVGEYFSGPWRESDVETSNEQERAAWDLVRQAFLYGPAATDSAATGPAAWLAGHGWTPGEVTTITELGSRHGRPAPPEFARASAPRVWLFDGTFGHRSATESAPRRD
jgi:methyltransferase (TIGR00027 family)